MTQTENSTPGVEQLPIVETHNCYTLYELDEDGYKESTRLLTFSRPQDWANPKRWHYHYCKIELSFKGTHYINHCHIWQGVERNTFEACKYISQSLFMFMQPGKAVELCANTHLAEEDFWLNEWGDKPPVFYDPDEYFDEEDY